MGDLVAAEVADLRLGGAGARLEHDPGADLLAVLRVGDAEDLHLRDLGVAEQELLDLARIDVLATADQHVLDAADDVAVALGIDRGQVAGVHPAVDDCRRGALGIVPVAEHHAVALGAQLARLADRHDGAVGVDDLDLQVRHHAADGRHALVHRVVDAALERHRRGLGHAVGDRHLGHVHLAVDALHDLDRAGRAGHDAAAQTAQVEVGEARRVEFGDEHRRHAVQMGAALVVHRAQRGQRVEALAREDHRGAGDGAGQRAHHHPEAVVQRHRDAQAVAGIEVHRARDVAGVVDDVVMGQRRAFRVAGGAAGELDVDGIEAREAGADAARLGHAGSVGPCQNHGQVEHAGRGLAAHPDHGAQVGQPRGLQDALARNARARARASAACRYWLVLNAGALMMPLQATLLSAYSSSASR